MVEMEVIVCPSPISNTICQYNKYLFTRRYTAVTKSNEQKPKNKKIRCPHARRLSTEKESYSISHCSSVFKSKTSQVKEKQKKNTDRREGMKTQITQALNYAIF